MVRHRAGIAVVPDFASRRTKPTARISKFCLTIGPHGTKRGGSVVRVSFFFSLRKTFRCRLVRRRLKITYAEMVSAGGKMHLRKLGVAFFIAMLASVLSATPSFSQNVYGTIAGTVTDPSGAAITTASVTLTNLDTNVKHAIETDASGNYTFVNILPGRYKVEVEKSGFKKVVRQPIIVEIESGLRVDITLQV